MSNLKDRIVAAATHTALSSKGSRNSEATALENVQPFIDWIEDGKSDEKIDFRITALRIVTDTSPMVTRFNTVMDLAQKIVDIRHPAIPPRPTSPEPTVKPTSKKKASKKKATRRKTVG